MFTLTGFSWRSAAVNCDRGLCYRSLVIVLYALWDLLNDDEEVSDQILKMLFGETVQWDIKDVCAIGIQP